MDDGREVSGNGFISSVQYAVIKEEEYVNEEVYQIAKKIREKLGMLKNEKALKTNGTTEG
jgi:hypothetical protein